MRVGCLELFQGLAHISEGDAASATLPAATPRVAAIAAATPAIEEDDAGLAKRRDDDKSQRRRRLRKELAKGLRRPLNRRTIVHRASDAAARKRAWSSIDNAPESKLSKRAKLVTQVWNSSVASTMREQLDDAMDFHKEKKRNKTDRVKDGRCLTTAFAQRRV